MQVFLKTEEVEKKITRMNKQLSAIAYELDIHPTYLSKMLSGDRSLTPKIRENFMKVLNVSDWDEIFEERE